MNNPYHAMLAEMAAELDWSQQRLMGNRTATHPLANRARVLIAQPEPPSPISAHDLAIQWNQQADQSEQWDSLDLYEQLAWAQSRAIAADRAQRSNYQWTLDSSPQPQPSKPHTQQGALT